MAIAKIMRLPNPDRLMFTVPNGDDDPAHNVQFYQLSGLHRRDDFEAAATPRAKLAAIGHGISGVTMDRFSDDEVARLCAAYAEWVAPAKVTA